MARALFPASLSSSRKQFGAITPPGIDSSQVLTNPYLPPNHPRRKSWDPSTARMPPPAAASHPAASAAAAVAPPVAKEDDEGEDLGYLARVAVKEPQLHTHKLSANLSIKTTQIMSSSSLILLTPVKKRMSSSTQSSPPPPPIRTTNTKLVRFSLTHMVYDKEDCAIEEDVFFLVAPSSVGVVNNSTDSVTRPKRDYEKSRTTNANVSSPQPQSMIKSKRSSVALHPRPRPWKKLKISLFD
jgi:hypothetical protein